MYEQKRKLRRNNFANYCDPCAQVVTKEGNGSTSFGPRRIAQPRNRDLGQSILHVCSRFKRLMRRKRLYKAGKGLCREGLYSLCEVDLMGVRPVRRCA